MQTRYGKIEVPDAHVLNRRDQHFRLSALMQEQVCWVGQEVVFDKSPEVFERFYGIEVSDKQTERVSEYYGSRLEEEEVAALETGVPYESPTLTKDDEDTLHYAMLDGAQFLFRELGWKEAKLGRIFKASDCLSVSSSRTELHQSDYCAHMGNASEFLQKFDRRLDRLPHIVFIADGAPWIWDWVLAHHPEQTQILDFYHAAEHLAKFANEHFVDQAVRSQWIETQKSRLLNDQLDLLIEELRSMKARNKATAETQRKLENYYWKNYHRMQYKTFRDQGFLIGSGAIEAAHRHVMQHRLKLSGQRWSPQGFQAIAKLRCLQRSGLWTQVRTMITQKNAA